MDDPDVCFLLKLIGYYYGVVFYNVNFLKIMWCQNIRLVKTVLNPFHATNLFLYPLKTSEKPKAFKKFEGVWSS